MLGLLFFVGLWETVKHLSNTRYPAMWMLASLVVRFALTLAGFYALAQYGGWEHLLAGLMGFTLPRIIMVRRLRPWQSKKELKQS